MSFSMSSSMSSSAIWGIQLSILKETVTAVPSKLLFWTLLLISISLAEPACYSRNGARLTAADFPSSDFQPCNLILGATSMCCATNRTALPGALLSEHPRDTCLPNGLCQFVSTEEDVTHYQYYIDGCSNPNWDGCLKNVADICKVCAIILQENFVPQTAHIL